LVYKLILLLVIITWLFYTMHMLCVSDKFYETVMTRIASLNHVINTTPINLCMHLMYSVLPFKSWLSLCKQSAVIINICA